MIFYPTKQALYDSCSIDEFDVIAVVVYNSFGEFLGYKKEYID